MPAFCEEVFGPVASLIKVYDVDEAVAVANQSAYGLGASVWTADLGRARWLAREIEAGTGLGGGRSGSRSAETGGSGSGFAEDGRFDSERERDGDIGSGTKSGGLAFDFRLPITQTMNRTVISILNTALL